MSTKKASTKRADVDQTRESLVKLGMEYAADNLGELLSRAVKDNYSPHRLLDELILIELERREERRIKTSLRISGLPTGHTLDNFDWREVPGAGSRSHAAAAPHDSRAI